MGHLEAHQRINFFDSHRRADGQLVWRWHAVIAVSEVQEVPVLPGTASGQ